MHINFRGSRSISGGSNNRVEGDNSQNLSFVNNLRIELVNTEFILMLMLMLCYMLININNWLLSPRGSKVIYFDLSVELNCNTRTSLIHYFFCLFPMKSFQFCDGIQFVFFFEFICWTWRSSFEIFFAIFLVFTCYNFFN